MVRTGSAAAVKLEFGEAAGRGSRRGLWLVSTAGAGRGPDKYRVLELQRRRAQMRARRLLGLMG